jgi:hypothetical protein
MAVMVDTVDEQLMYHPWVEGSSNCSSTVSTLPANNPFMLSLAMPNVAMLNVVAPSRQCQ